MYKLIIIDDEQMIRDGLKNTINWHELGIDIVYTATDGEEGFELICQTNPDIIITDIRMPGFDGLELLEALKTVNRLYKVIIISGYGDFTYAQKAIKLGASDYILKPIDEHVLITQVKNCIQAIELENVKNQRYHFLENNFAQSKIMSDQLTLDFIIGNSKFNSTIKDNYNQLFNRIPYFQIGILNTSYVTYDQSIDLEDNILDKIYEIYTHHTYLPNLLVLKNQPYELIFIFGISTDTENCKLEITRFFQLLLDNIYMEIGCYVTIGISHVCTTFEELPSSYQEAVNAYSYKIVDSTLNIFDINTIQADSVSINFNEDVNNKVWSNVLNEDKQALHQLLLNIIQAHIISELKDINFLHIFIISILDYVFNKYHESLILSLYSTGKKKEIIEALELSKTPIDVFYTTREILFNLIDSLGSNQSSKKVMNEILSYISDHYHENISMSIIARQFYLSPSYFSKIFSEHVGEPFSKYLTQLRINKAKNLLSNPHLKIYHISNMVGYTDTRYFIKVFKNYELLTPLKYREKLLTNVLD